MPGLGGKAAALTPNVPQGTYFVKFVDFWPLDADSLPTLAENGLKIRYHVVVAGGESNGQQMAASLDASNENLKLLVEAFGGNPDKVQLDLDDVGSSLTLAMALMRKASKEVKGGTRGSGWLSYLEGLGVPKGNYVFGFGGFTSKNAFEELSWYEKDGQYGKQKKVSGTLVIRSEGPQKDRKIGFILSYPFLVDDEGYPAWSVTSKEGKTKSSQRWDEFFKAFGVEIDKVFERDAVKDPTNIVPEMADLLKGNTTLVSCEVNEMGFLETDKLTTLPEGVSIVRKSEDTSEAIKVLFTLINQSVEAEGGIAFNEDGSLTPEGKKWCTTHIAPIGKAKGFRPKFETMTVENIQEVLVGLGHAELAEQLDF